MTIVYELWCKHGHLVLCEEQEVRNLDTPLKVLMIHCSLCTNPPARLKTYFQENQIGDMQVTTTIRNRGPQWR